MLTLIPLVTPAYLNYNTCERLLVFILGPFSLLLIESWLRCSSVIVAKALLHPERYLLKGEQSRGRAFDRQVHALIQTSSSGYWRVFSPLPIFPDDLVVPILWAPKDHQGADSDVNIVGSLFYKHQLRVIHCWPSAGQVGEASLSPQRDKALQRWRASNKVSAWQTSNCMTIISGQVGTLKKTMNNQTVWKYIWNNQIIFDWLLLGSRSVVSAKDKPWGLSWYLGAAWVQPQGKFSGFLLRWSPVPRWNRFGLSVLSALWQFPLRA